MEIEEGRTSVLLINNKGILELVEMSRMAADAEVLGEVVEAGDDPLIAILNPFVGPHDGWLWPENMFSGPRVRLSKYQEAWVMYDGPSWFLRKDPWGAVG